MKYFYTILSITAVVVIQMIDTKLVSITRETPRVDTRSSELRPTAEDSFELPPVDTRIDRTNNVSDPEGPYGLHYNSDENLWTLYATVLQLKKTSVYGRLGEIAQIEYSLDGQTLRNGWIVLRIDSYSFVDGSNDAAAIKAGQDIQLYISGVYVSSLGVDWDKCPIDDTYCIHASFVEGGFPKSEDYRGLTLCPSNSIIYAGFLPEDWINGILAWTITASWISRNYPSSLH